MADWQQEVANNQTRRGYLDWVDAKREDAAEQKWSTLDAEALAEIEAELMTSAYAREDE